jgi:alpha-L-glutamate ligase-like protein
VDNKLRTKALAEEHGMTVAETYGVLRNPHDANRVEKFLKGNEAFVIKPTRGSGGKGIMVIDKKVGKNYVKPSGNEVTPADVKNHVSNILAGLFSLGGKRDYALIEYRVQPAKLLTDMSFQGAPDIRVVMLHGYPVMAMLRASTKESDGRSNLHQGALGIGIDIATGMTVRAIHHGKPMTHHPDLGIDLIGVQIPDWDTILHMAVTCQEMTGLGYLGVDIMIDEDKGPLMIEVNARPGLAIQMANGIGLLKRLEPIVEQHRKKPTADLAAKIEFSKKHFRAKLPPARL